MKRYLLLILSLALLLVGCESGTQPAVEPESGARSRGESPDSAVLTRQVEGPTDFDGNAVTPRVVPGFAKAIPTNDWWTSLLWPYYSGSNFGENLYAHPLVMKALEDGLAIGLPSEATITPDDVHYTYHFTEDVRMGVEGLTSTEVLVEDYSDWTVTPRWESGSTWMNATIGHGLLFSYFRTNGETVKAILSADAQVFGRYPGALGVSIDGKAYGLFAPAGSNWQVSNTLASAPLNGRGYFSVALLPDAKLSTLQDFHQRAFSFVIDTRVSWSCEPGSVVSDYELIVEPMEGSATDPPVTLYRHQWLNTEETLKGWSFPTARGEMKGLFSSRFTTRTPFGGVLPNLPVVGIDDKPLLEAFLQEVAAEGPLVDKDTYFGGKDLGKLASVIPLAESVGRQDLKEFWLDQIQARLDTYFDGQAPYRFVYNDTWDTLLAEPVAFESDRQLNDHHFHYGYLLMGAATLARHRPDWAQQNRGSVNEMIADVANTDRASTRYPFLRSFDPYAGHSWAAGAQNFAGGNNQESSSESVHFSSALILWGSETGQDDLVELGQYLYATEVAAIWQYWFDKDEAVFPTGFQHPILGILWGGGGAYATWWTANQEEIHGINFLPIHAGSLYLGHHTSALQRNISHLLVQAGEVLEWRDIIWSAQAFLKPEETLQTFLAQRPSPEGGESRAHTYHWLAALNFLGVPRIDIGADVATFSVMEKNGELTYLAYNPSSTPVGTEKVVKTP